MLTEPIKETAMSGDIVERVCREVFFAREARRLTEERAHGLGRALAYACADCVETRATYSPEDDRRVWWARGVLQAVAGSAAMDGPLEATAVMLLGLAAEPATSLRGGQE